MVSRPSFAVFVHTDTQKQSLFYNSSLSLSWASTLHAKTTVLLSCTSWFITRGFICVCVVNNAEFTSRGDCYLLLSTQYITTGWQLDKAGAASFFVMHHFLYHQQYNAVYGWHHVGHVQLQTPTFTGTPEKNWQNAEDDDDVVDIRSGLTETGSAQLSLMIYAACALESRLCVHGSQLQIKKHKLVNN